MPPSGDSRRNNPTTTKTVLVVAASAAVAATALVAFAAWRARRAKRTGEWPSPKMLKMSQAQNVVWGKSLEELPTEAPVVVVDGAYLLAEGPVWCAERNELWWVGEFCVCVCAMDCFWNGWCSY